ncbi:glycine/betaine ABC transporter permease [Bacillus wudalianchiensis]|uniref:Glycine/betaine ABC transporter permease n=1 Tax=Pseudobacillus wudalianchiensis TaxID=1743143 RepID=A0A1B9B6U4_9BACI|nr:glycine/betaine ABC transporter permease [Bacillus wudalianchiensis]
MITSLLFSLAFVLFGILKPEKLGEFSSYFLLFANDYFGWFYILSATSFVVICLYVAFSKYGKIRLGKDTDRPEFSTGSWIAMLFSAGLAISLFFWGVAEPVMHYMSPPVGEGQTPEAAKAAMKTAFFHWGLHSWGTYAIVGLIIAYFHHRKGYPPLVNYAFYPLLGNKVHGPIGKLINVLTIFAILSGLVTSLGLGAKQLGAGLNYVWGIQNTSLNQILLISFLTVLFITSAYYGLDKGIKNLSNFNIVLAVVIMTVIFILGPTKQILQIFVAGTGEYLQNIVGMSLRMEPFLPDNTWLSNWTIFYWGWAVSFATFVGLFVARISKGRTIKEFIIGSVIVPSLATMIWYSVFGGSALHFIQNLGDIDLANKVMNDVTTAFFYFLQYFPYSSILIVLTLISLVIFFVTSADSTVFVLGMLSEETSDPSNKSKILWGLVIAGLAIALLLSGGLSPLQSVSVAAGLPFTLIILFMCVSFFKSLRREIGVESNKENTMSNHFNKDSMATQDGVSASGGAKRVN